MALDPIWQQQLTLVSYGNEYLSHNLNFSRWIKHAIFNQHQFSFRDLNSQQLLAQHFQVWLEGLEAQGVTHLSLHSSNLLTDESNPNAQVELVPYAHFIVSHGRKHSHAWIFGKELAAWYQLENDYQIPTPQQGTLRHETLWRFELNQKLLKRIQADLQAPNWDEIHQFMQTELFDSILSQAWAEPENIGLPYEGQTVDTEQSVKLALLPTDHQADYAHQSLHRLMALSSYIQAQQNHAVHTDGSSFTADDHAKYRHFTQKIDDLTSKFIVKVANHYKTAQLTKVEPLTQTAVAPIHKASTTKITSKNVLALLVVTITLCTLAYYFGL